MLASIIIPSLNSPLIGRVLDRLRIQQDAHSLDEVLVVGLDEAGLIGRRDRVRLVDTGVEVSASRARNLGIEQARNELLVFLDSDCLPEPDWLSIHLREQGTGCQIVGGSVKPQGENYWSLTYNLSMFHEYLANLPRGTRNYLPSLNLSVQRLVIDQVGLFDEELALGQDLDWTIRCATRRIITSG